MPTRAEMKRAYKEAPRPAGVYRIKNTANGRVFLGRAADLRGPLNRHRAQLEFGSHPNAELQEDWRRFGAGAFVFEVVETLPDKREEGFDLEGELLLLAQVWAEREQPFGARGYNVVKDFQA